MFRQNVKILIISAIAFSLGALCLFNVLLIDVKGIHMNSGINLNDYNGISYVEDEIIPASRGKIYDNRGAVLAQDIEAWDVIAYVSPDRPGNNLGTYYVDDVKGTAEKLAAVLGADQQELEDLMSQDVFMTYLGAAGRGISTEKKEEIEALELNGIEFERVKGRYYPYTPYASHLIGFAGYTYAEDGGENTLQGKTGIEADLNDYLTGTPGRQSYYRDTTGNSIVGQVIENTPAVNGNDVYLTLDDRIQSALKSALVESYDLGWSTESAWGIIMEAKTGKIVGYDCYPTYNQNTLDIKDYQDLNAMLAYEPGSTMKTFAYAAAIDYGGLDPNDTFDSSNFMIGEKADGNIERLYWYAPNYVNTITNFRGWTYGTVDYWYGFAASLNTGAVSLLEKYVDRDTYEQYMENFGFFKPIGILGIPYEAEGVKNMTYVTEVATTTYGQGSSFTALQVVQGYSAFANGGKMVKPYIIDKIVDSQTGETVYQGETEYTGQPVSESTAKTILQMMEKTSDPNYDGSGRYYYIDGVRIAIKTGTAEVVDSNGEYGNRSIHSAVVMMPADDPELIIYMCVKDSDAYYTHNHDVWQQLERTCADVYNLYDRPGASKREEVTPRVVYQDGMPNLINHSEQYANNKLNSMDIDIVKLGSGSTVLAQYPLPATTLISKQRVMLLMGGNDFEMPNMIGWSRKEVTAFWELTGIEVVLDGSGYVTSQSIEAGELINSSSQITVKLE
ncbi:MAG: PASTA domain-containing protein [Erysipelotrichaceae bacterium]|nr:PASTA domain-containing protein [Erysipelotrichaceae bacterium]